MITGNKKILGSGFAIFMLFLYLVVYAIDFS